LYANYFFVQSELILFLTTGILESLCQIYNFLDKLIDFMDRERRSRNYSLVNRVDLLDLEARWEWKGYFDDIDGLLMVIRD